MSAARAPSRGDMNGDLAIRLPDFLAFSAAYAAANPDAVRLWRGVSEPSSVAVLLLGGLAGGALPPSLLCRW